MNNQDIITIYMKKVEAINQLLFSMNQMKSTEMTLLEQTLKNAQVEVDALGDKEYGYLHGKKFYFIHFITDSLVKLSTKPDEFFTLHPNSIMVDINNLKFL
jgi:hypothetical protein